MIIARWFCGPAPSRPPPPAIAKEAVIGHHAALVSIAGIRPSPQSPPKRRGIGVLIHPTLILTTHSTIPSPQSISDADITVCRDIRSLTYVKRKFVPELFFETDADLDLTVVWCEMTCPEVQTLPLDTTKIHRRALRRGHSLFVMGCQRRSPEDVAVLDGRILSLIQSSADPAFVDLVRFQSGDDAWMPGSVVFDEFGSFSFIVTKPTAAAAAAAAKTEPKGGGQEATTQKKLKQWGTSVIAIKHWIEPLWKQNRDTIFHAAGDSPAAKANVLTLKQLLSMQQQSDDNHSIVERPAPPIRSHGGDYVQKSKSPDVPSDEGRHGTAGAGRAARGDGDAYGAVFDPRDSTVSVNLSGSNRDQTAETTPAPSEASSAKSGTGGRAERRERQREDRRGYSSPVAVDIDGDGLKPAQRRGSPARLSANEVEKTTDPQEKRRQQQKRRTRKVAARGDSDSEEEDRTPRRGGGARKARQQVEQRRRRDDGGGERKAATNSRRFVDDEDEFEDGGGGADEEEEKPRRYKEWMDEDEELEAEDKEEDDTDIDIDDDHDDEEEEEEAERRGRGSKMKERRKGEEEGKRGRQSSSTPSRMIMRGGEEGDSEEERSAATTPRRRRGSWGLPSAAAEEEEQGGFELAATPVRTRSLKKSASNSDYTSVYPGYYDAATRDPPYDGGGGSGSRKWMDDYFYEAGSGDVRRTSRRGDDDDEQDVYLPSAAPPARRSSVGGGEAEVAYSKPTISYIQKRNSTQRETQRGSRRASETPLPRWV